MKFLILCCILIGVGSGARLSLMADEWVEDPETLETIRQDMATRLAKIERLHAEYTLQAPGEFSEIRVVWDLPRRFVFFTMRGTKQNSVMVFTWKEPEEGVVAFVWDENRRIRIPWKYMQFLENLESIPSLFASVIQDCFIRLGLDPEVLHVEDWRPSLAIKLEQNHISFGMGMESSVNPSLGSWLSPSRFENISRFRVEDGEVFMQMNDGSLMILDERTGLVRAIHVFPEDSEEKDDSEEMEHAKIRLVDLHVGLEGKDLEEWLPELDFHTFEERPSSMFDGMMWIMLFKLYGRQLEEHFGVEEWRRVQSGEMKEQLRKTMRDRFQGLAHRYFEAADAAAFLKEVLIPAYDVSMENRPAMQWMTFNTYVQDLLLQDPSPAEIRSTPAYRRYEHFAKAGLELTFEQMEAHERKALEQLFEVVREPMFEGIKEAFFRAHLQLMLDNFFEKTP